jgi:hypothetical protein
VRFGVKKKDFLGIFFSCKGEGGIEKKSSLFSVWITSFRGGGKEEIPAPKV